MKKGLAFLAALLLIIVFTGCGTTGRGESSTLGDDDGSSWRGSGSEEGQSSTLGDDTGGDTGSLVQSNKDEKLQISVINSNKVKITFTDDVIENLSVSVSGDNTKIHNAIEIDLRCDGQERYSICCNRGDWWIYTNNGEWNGGRTPEQIIEGNSVTWEIQKANIVEDLQNCNEYRVVYQDYLNDGTTTILCEGKVIVPDDEAYAALNDEVQFVFMDEDTVKVYISDASVAEKINQGSVKLQLFASEENQRMRDPALSFQIHYDGEYGSVELAKCYSEQTGENEYLLSEELMTGDDGARIEGQIIVNEEGYIFKYQGKNLFELIKDNAWYTFTDIEGERCYLGKVDNMQIQQYTQPEIPRELLSDHLDMTYFANVTDDYSVIVESYADYQNPVFSWQHVKHQVTGETDWFYIADENDYKMSKVPVKVVMIESYDEFGLCSRYAAAVYENEADALADITRPISAKEAGITQINDDFPTAEYLVDSYKGYVSSVSNGNEDYLLGAENNVLYFGYSVAFPYNEDEHENNWFFHTPMGRAFTPLKRDVWNLLRANGTLSDNFSYSYEFQNGSAFIIQESNSGIRVGEHFIMQK